MAKNNNLTDFLTDVANAIREKKNSSDPINPQDFSAEIASIETGGGGASVVAESDVNFRDYDGTILHSYSKDEFLALTALPQLPTQPGLICQEWNWTFAEAQSYVQEYGLLEVGATYITDDGKTRLYITIPNNGRLTIPLYIKQSASTGVLVDWGDGSTKENKSGSGEKTFTHTYASPGDYIISLEVRNGTLTLGHNNGTYTLLGTVADTSKYAQSWLTKIEIGSGLIFGLSSLNHAISLKSVTIPNTITTTSADCFRNCYSLEYLALPKSITIIANYCFASNYKLVAISLPNSITQIGNRAFSYIYTLQKLILPDSLISLGDYALAYTYANPEIRLPNNVTTIGTNTFAYCYGLRKIAISKTKIEQLPDSAFYGDYSLTKIKFPKTLTKIDSQAFVNAYALFILDFSESEAVVTLSASPAIGSTDWKAIVPDALYEAWRSAPYWSGNSTHIVKASDYSNYIE